MGYYSSLEIPKFKIRVTGKEFDDLWAQTLTDNHKNKHGWLRHYDYWEFDGEDYVYIPSDYLYDQKNYEVEDLLQFISQVIDGKILVNWYGEGYGDREHFLIDKTGVTQLEVISVTPDVKSRIESLFPESIFY